MSFKLGLARSALLVVAMLSGSGLHAAEERSLVANGSFEFWTPVNEELVKDQRLDFQGANPQTPTRWDFSRAVTRDWVGSRSTSR